MTVNGIRGVNAGAGAVGMGQTSDPVSRDLQRQIDDAKRKLQELSSKEDMSMEEKMKKRQEIQKQISDLNMQLRQHQMDMRRQAAEEEDPEAAEKASEERLAGAYTPVDVRL